MLWDNVPAWGQVDESGVRQQTPDLSAIVQEIIDLNDWAFDKPIAFIIVGSGKRVARSYNNDPSKAPKLHIEYTSNVVEVRVSNSSDDAEQRLDQADNPTVLYSSDLDLRQDRLAGIRFPNIHVPPGAEITRAYIEFTSYNTNTGTAGAVIDLQDHDNPPTFANKTNDISDRALIGNSVQWDPIPYWDTSWVKHQTPDLSALIQQIVGRPGWHGGNAMVFVIQGLRWNRSAATYDASPDLAPLLHIEYGEGEIGADEPIITVDTDYLGANCVETRSPIAGIVKLSNTGTGKLNYKITSSATWLTVFPDAAELIEGSEQNLTVIYNTLTLAPGTYEATITISDSYAINNPVEIQVSVTIEPLPEQLTCGHIPVYAENLVSPAILILLDVSGSMKTMMDLAAQTNPRTPDLSTIMQEIVDRDGWQSGNAMAFMVEGTGRRTAVSYNGDSAKAPKLYVRYYDPSDLSEHEIEQRIYSGTDDAEEEIGGTWVNINSGDLEMSYDNGNSSDI